jgi:hypothetical protein
MKKSYRVLPARTLAASLALAALLPAGVASADIALNDPEKTDGWAVKTSGQVNAYANYIFGETINRSNLGNLINPTVDPTSRYRLVGPQVSIHGNATPSSAKASPVDDKDLGTFRIRGGFASTILNFIVSKQLLADLKLDIKLGLWAGIDNAQAGGLNGVRYKNDAAPVDWREQFVDLSGSWGIFWGGRKLGLYNRGGMRMNWFLMHQHGIGHPCNVDGSGTAQCGHTGVGSMFPNRNAQIGYATPELAGLQLSVAMFDGAMINEQWNRTPLPRFEAEATFKMPMGGPKDYPNEINAWANGLTQVVGRTQEVAQQLAVGHPGIPADKTLNVWGVGGGAWGRFGGFGLGGTGWYGAGLGTATPFGNTAVDDIGMLRTHFGYLAIANFRVGKFEIAASYGSTNVQETDWDKNPNPAISDKVSVIKQVRGIGGKLAYHIVPAVVFSIDGLNLHHTWWRNETQNANVISGGLVAKW